MKHTITTAAAARTRKTLQGKIAELKAAGQDASAFEAALAVLPAATYTPSLPPVIIPRNGK